MCFMQNVSQIGPVVQKKKSSEWFLLCMHMKAILKFGNLVYPQYKCLTCNFIKIGSLVS